jgi:uncharacterized protein (TIGR01244 family)
MKPPATAAVEKAPLGDILNVSRTGDLYLCGQPTAGDIARLKEQGVKTVITLRTPGEVTQFDEAKLVADAGLRFVSLPFKSAQEMDDALFDRARALLNDGGNYPIVLHCGSANRVAAVWITHRVLDQGVDAGTALREAKLIGLKNAEMEARAMKYIEARQAK